MNFRAKPERYKNQLPAIRSGFAHLRLQSSLRSTRPWGYVHVLWTGQAGEKTCGNCPASSSPPDANGERDFIQLIRLCATMDLHRCGWDIYVRYDCSSPVIGCALECSALSFTYIHQNVCSRVVQQKHQAMRKQYQEVQSTMQRAYKWKGKPLKEFSHWLYPWNIHFPLINVLTICSCPIWNSACTSSSASLRSLSLGSECVHVAYQLVGLRCPGCLFLYAAVRESSHVGWLTRPFDKIHVFVTIIFSFVKNIHEPPHVLRKVLGVAG